ESTLWPADLGPKPLTPDSLKITGNSFRPFYPIAQAAFSVARALSLLKLLLGFFASKTGLESRGLGSKPLSTPSDRWVATTASKLRCTSTTSGLYVSGGGFLIS